MWRQLSTTDAIITQGLLSMDVKNLIKGNQVLVPERLCILHVCLEPLVGSWQLPKARRDPWRWKGRMEASPCIPALSTHHPGVLGLQRHELLM